MVKELDKGTEEQILAAAYRVILRRGKAGTRMQEIADEAGVNKALLHYYFRSKDKIYMAVLHTIVGSLLKSLFRELDFSGSLRQLLETFIRGHIAAVRENQEIFQFFFSEIWTNREEVIPVFHEIITSVEGNLPRMFFARVEQAVKEGEIRPVVPIHLLVDIISMNVFFFIARPIFTSIMELSPEQQAAVVSERADHVVEFVWESIRSREEH